MRFRHYFGHAGIPASRLLLAAIAVLGAIHFSALRLAFAADNATTGFHFLAADPSLRAQLRNANVIPGQATFVGKVLQLDQSWEAPFMIMYPGSIVTDPANGQWRMYYEVFKSENERFVALATSGDGVHWIKPRLNITGTTYTRDRRNNFVQSAQTWAVGPNVFVDPTAPAGERYRMTTGVGATTLYADASADGLHWRQVAVITSGETDVDSQNTAFWDPRTKQYIAYIRHWYPADGVSPMRRGLVVRRSSTFDTKWTGPLESTIDPAKVSGIGPGPAKPDMYCSSALPYYGQYVGLPSMFYHVDSNPSGNGPLYPTFMYSRDGSNWSFQDAYHPIIDLGGHGHFPSDDSAAHSNFGQAYMMTSLPERNGELYLYYTYFPVQHASASEPSGQIYLAKLREDRFVGIQSAGNGIGTWTTSHITLSGNPGHLKLNAVVGGSVRVEVLDAAGTAIKGFQKASSLAIGTGDYLDALARWTDANSLNALAGRTVTLKFYLDHATIYSFHFSL
jgi:hypothetical protein